MYFSFALDTSRPNLWGKRSFPTDLNCNLKGYSNKSAPSLLPGTEIRQLEAERFDQFGATGQIGRDAQANQNVLQPALPE
jgi:hypothetical protein